MTPQATTRQAELQHIIDNVLKDEKYVKESLAGLKISDVSQIVKMKRLVFENGKYDNNGTPSPIPEDTIEALWALQKFIKFKNCLTDPDDRINGNYLSMEYGEFQWYCSCLHDYDTGDYQAVAVADQKGLSKERYEIKLQHQLAELQHVITNVFVEEEHIQECINVLKITSVQQIIALNRTDLENGTYDNKGTRKPIPELTLEGIWAFKHYVAYRDSLADPDDRICGDYFKTNYKDFNWYCCTLHDFDRGDITTTEWDYQKKLSNERYDTKMKQSNPTVDNVTFQTTRPPYKKSPVEGFKKGIQREPSNFPQLNDNQDPPVESILDAPTIANLDLATLKDSTADQFQLDAEHEFSGGRNNSSVISSDTTEYPMLHEAEQFLMTLDLSADLIDFLNGTEEENVKLDNGHGEDDIFDDGAPLSKDPDKLYDYKKYYKEWLHVMLELTSVFCSQKSCSSKLCTDTVFDGEVNQEITLCPCATDSSGISLDLKDSSMLADGEASPSNFGVGECGKSCNHTVFDGEVYQEITLCPCATDSSGMSLDIKDSSMLADGEASPSNYGERINSPTPNDQLVSSATALNNGESINSPTALSNGESINSPMSTELIMSSISPVTSSGSASFGIQLRPQGSTSKVPSFGNHGRPSQVAHSSSLGVSTLASTTSAHDLRMARDTAIRIKQLSTGDTAIRAKQINLKSSRDFGPVTIKSRVARTASSQLKANATKACLPSYTAKSALRQACQHCVSCASSTPMSYCEAVQQGLSSAGHCQCTPTTGSTNVTSDAHSVDTTSCDVTSPTIAHLTRLSIGDSVLVQPLVASAGDVSVDTSSRDVTTPSNAHSTSLYAGDSVFVKPLAAFTQDVSLPPGHASPVSIATSTDTAVENISVLSDGQKIVDSMSIYPALSSGPIISHHNTPVVATVDYHTLAAIGKSLRNEKGSYTACYGRSYQLSGPSVTKHLPNSLRLALSNDCIALGVDSDRGGAYVNLITADSIASGIDSDRGGGTMHLLTRGRISSRPGSQLSVALLLMIRSHIQLLQRDQANFEDISDILSEVYCLKPSVRKIGTVDNMVNDNFGKEWLDGIFMGSIMV